jgi:8-oxo-dGTP pyrophosphatase MutT (NUDIX family)
VGKFLELVTTDDGWEYFKRVNCKGASIVLVYHVDREEYLMVEQFRPPVNRRVLEWPAGLMDEGETPEQTAVRELFEETGVRITEDDLINLGALFSGVGVMDEEVNIFAVEINNDTVIQEPDVQGVEVKHKLVVKWVKEKDLYRIKGAKGLSVYARYKAKKQYPDIVFDD